MATYGVETVVQYVAWDTANNAGKTGDAANHTLRWVKDGTSAAPTNSPSEVDATNAPGVYKLTLTAAECQAVAGTLCGVSATADVSIMPVSLTFSRLPNAAPGANGGLPTVDANNRIVGIQGTKNDLDDLNDLSAADVNAQADLALSDYAPARAGDAMTLTAAYDAAKTAAQAGDAMDLVNAPNATAVTAIQSGLSTHSAADVWTSDSRTLSSFGTLVADIATAVWGATARTLTAFGFTPNANVTQVGGTVVSGPADLKADVSTLATSAEIAALNDLSEAQVQAIADAIKTHGDTTWSTADLTGVSTLTEAQVQAIVDALNDLSSADAQAAVTAALNAYDPPTKAELDAVVSPLATEATLTALKGAGWTDETLKAIKDAVDAMSTGGDATAANQNTIIAHLTDIKGETWTTETLVALGALLNALPTEAEVNAEVVAALADYGAPTDAELDAAVAAIRGADNDTLKTLSDAIDGISAGDATEAKQNEILASLDEAKGATFDTTTDSLEAIRDQGDSAWVTGGSGSGTNTVTLTFTDTNGAALADTKITVKGTGITATTTSLGVATFYLDDGIYTFVSPSTGTHDGEENEVVVSGDTEAAITVTAKTFSEPEEAGYCRVHVYAKEENGDIPSSGTFKVIRLESPDTTGSGTGTVTVVLGDNEASLDAVTGHAYLDIVQGAKVDLALYTHGRKTPIVKRGKTIPASSAVSWEELS